MHAFDLIELQLHIARYLELAHLKACATVCKAWHAVFQTEVWKRAVLRENHYLETFDSQRDASRHQSLRKNAQWIQNLTIPPWTQADAREVHEILIDCCRSLFTIDVTIRYVEDSLRYIQLLRANSSGLREVKLRFGLHEAPVTQFGFHRTLAVLPQLQVLELECRMTVVGLVGIMVACPRLKTLILPSEKHTLHGGMEAQGISIPPSLRFQLQQLHIGAHCVGASLAMLLIRCPKLVALYLNSASSPTWRTVGRVLSLPHCFQHLTKLHLRGSTFSDANEAEHVVVTFPLQRLVEVQLWTTTAIAIQSLAERQNQSLEIFQVCVHQREVGALCDIFTKCTRLKSLTIHSDQGEMDVRCLIGNQPWACTSLEYLEARFGLANPCTDENLIEVARAEKEALAAGQPEWEQAEVVFLKRLGQLTQIRHIDLQDDIFRSTDHFVQHQQHHQQIGPLTWSLRNGLIHLTTWSRLEIFDFGNNIVTFGLPELQFMKDHWKSLKRLRCPRHEFIDVQSWLDQHWPTVIS